MSALGTALSVETLAWRRATVQRVAAPLLVLVVPLAVVGLVGLARSGAMDGPTAAKLVGYTGGPLPAVYAEAAGQVLSVAVLVAAGFAVAAQLGQPLADGRAGASFTLATGRTILVVARCLVVTAWAVACTVGAVVLTLGAAVVAMVATGEPFGTETWAALGRALLAGWLGAGLGLPFALVATATRSPLATVGALIGVVAVTQIVVAVGAGSWFPYSVPSLWTGMGGAEAAAQVPAAALWLTAAVAPAALAGAGWQWRRLDDV